MALLLEHQAKRLAVFRSFLLSELFKDFVSFRFGSSDFPIYKSIQNVRGSKGVAEYGVSDKAHTSYQATKGKIIFLFLVPELRGY